MGSNNERGVTLIELLIVISLIGIIAGSITLRIGGFLGTSQAKLVQGHTIALFNSARLWYQNEDRMLKYLTLGELVQKKYANDIFCKNVSKSTLADEPFYLCSGAGSKGASEAQNANSRDPYNQSYSIAATGSDVNTITVYIHGTITDRTFRNLRSSLSDKGFTVTRVNNNLVTVTSG